MNKLVPVWYPHDQEELSKLEAIMERVDVPHEFEQESAEGPRLLVAAHAAEQIHRLLLSALTEGEVGDDDSESGLILPPW